MARDGSAPGAGALLVRNVFRLIDSLPVLYCVGLVAVIATREHLRVGDMAAGTLLVYERDAAHLPPAARARRVSMRGRANWSPSCSSAGRPSRPTPGCSSAQQLLARHGGGAACRRRVRRCAARCTVLLHGTAGAPP